MCDETQSPKVRKFVTYADVKAERQKVDYQFALELKRLQDAGASLREIAEMKKMNHEKVRQLLMLVNKGTHQTHTRT